MIFRRSIDDARKALAGLWAGTQRGRAVLDLTGAEIVLAIADGRRRVVGLGDDLPNAVERLRSELPAGFVVNCVIPARLVTLRRWPVPNASVGAVENVVAARVGAEMPGSSAQLYWSFDLAASQTGRLATVYLVRRQYIENISSLLEAAGFAPGVYENEASILVAMAREKVTSGDVLVFRKSNGVGLLVAADRSGPMQVHSVAAPSKNVDWVPELAARWREHWPDSRNMRLLVDPATEQDIQGALEDALGIQPEVLCSYAKPWTAHPVAGAACLLPRAGRHANLNPHVTRRRRMKKAEDFLAHNMRAAVVMAALLVLVGGVFCFALARLTRTGVHDALTRVRLAQDRMGSIERKKAMLELVSRRRVDAPGLLSAVSGAAPEKLRLTEYGLRGTTLRLTGMADTAGIEGFVEQLKALTVVRSVEILSIRGGRFEIRCIVAPGVPALMPKKKLAASRPGEEVVR